jgi:serine/threonine-protein kinase haspin
LQTGFGLSGLETTIIDYSLSRADFPSADYTDGFSVAWSDLDKKGIFNAVGRDPEEALLRDTYRRYGHRAKWELCRPFANLPFCDYSMRSHIYQNNFLDEERPPKVPKQWQSYNPGTNLIWLSFVLKVLLMRYKPSKSPCRRALGERDVNRQMVDRTPKASGNSKTEGCEALYTQKPDLAGHSLDAELLERLEAVVEFFDTENAEFTCAGDLVATAIGLQWLDEADFLC